MKNLILVAIATFAISAHAMKGQEGGGGGDAVIQNGEMVIRDLLNQNVTPVLDQKAFLKSVPGFDQLIKDIAKVTPEFATYVVRDLMMSQIYLSRRSLPLLPHQLTALNGVRATVQIAVRYGDDIVFAPEFAKLSVKQRKYIVIHEALHGLLSSQSGPLHHDRIRNIVNHLYKNEGKLDKATLNAVLAANKFFSIDSGLNPMLYKYLWDESVEQTLRCHQIQVGFSYYEIVAEYLDLNCPDLWTSMVNLREKYPEVVDVKTYLSSRNNYGLRDEFVMYPLTLLDPKSINKYGKRVQEIDCAQNERDYKKVSEIKSKMDKAVAAIESLKTKLGEEVLKEFAGAYYARMEYNENELASIQKRLKDDLVQYNESTAAYQKGRQQCEKYYPKKEWIR